MSRLKYSLIYLGILLSMGSYAQVHLLADSVVAYEWDFFRTRQLQVALEKGHVEKRRVLTREQSRQILARLDMYDTYGEMQAACFDPQFGIIWYKDGEVLEFIEICFGCNNAKGSLEFAARAEREYPESGFSRKGWTALRDICRSYGFERCPERRAAIFEDP